MIRFLNRLSQIRRRYSQRPFWFRTEFQKGHCFCYCVFRKLSYVNQPEFLWRSSHRNSGFFYFQKGRLPFGALFQPFSCFWEDGFFCFLRTLSCVSKRALEEMEVKIEESEQWKFQTQTNQTGIPFPYRSSRSDGEAHLYSVPIVRGMPLSRPRLSLSGRGRGMYAHTTDETI